MRDLILMRGAPGSGKSTWIAQNGLEWYTIASDNVRMMWSQPVPEPETGEPTIRLWNENQVWDNIEAMIEYRMKNGQFIVLDAQNMKPQRWIKLAEKYRYHVWVKDMLTPFEECLKRNREREHYKFVPEKEIEAAFLKKQACHLSNSVKPVPDDVVNGIIQPLNVDKYQRIFVIGDIHGCYTPLKEFFDSVGGPVDSDLYVFVGDYLDRGLENRETLEFLSKFYNNRNFMFLEGNHVWERFWAHDMLEEIRSREFLDNTMPQIEGVDKKIVREWCRRWQQLAYLDFHGQKYFITHAGLGWLPEKMRFVPSHVYIKGESYSDDVDKWWHEKDTGGVIQVHGHRNTYCYDADFYPDSINLCSEVEFGETLDVLEITHAFDAAVAHRILHFKNPKPRQGLSNKRKFAILMGSEITQPEAVQLFVDRLRASRDIQEKELNPRLSSFQFKRDVFYTAKWNDINTIARGLFVDTKDWRIVARSYIKFFNLEERDKNRMDWLSANLEFPVRAYRKYNGFLGMVSWDPITESIHYFSKTSDGGFHALLCKEIVEANVGDRMEQFKSYLLGSKCTFVFEILTKRDPHVIYESDRERAILLDIIYNQVDFKRLSYEYVQKAGETFGFKVKELDAEYGDWESLEPALKDRWVHDAGVPVEGWVLEDAKGYMLKLKTQYYHRWRELRNIKNSMGDKESTQLMWMLKDAMAGNIRGNVIRRMIQIPGPERKEMSISDVRALYVKEGGTDWAYDEKWNGRGEDTNA